MSLAIAEQPKESHMKLMVEGHVPAWCYVDTETGEVELIEVWAWESEFSFRSNEDVISEAADEDDRVPRSMARLARRIAREGYGPAPFTVALDHDETRVETRVRN
jgi:hypothetical protein